MEGLLLGLGYVVDPIFQNHAGVVGEDAAGGDGHLFTGLWVTSLAVLLAFYLEVAEPGNLQLPIINNDLFHQFEHLICKLC